MSEMNQAIDDTAPWARDLLVQRWRSLESSEKIRIMSEHSIALQRLSIAGLRLRHPLADDDELALRAAVLRVGRETFERLTGKRLEW